MRVAGVVLAVLMIAACPPRRARIVYAQPYPVPSVTVSAPPVSPPQLLAKPTDPAVEEVLDAWEKKIAGITNFRTEITLKRSDAIFKKETEYTGTALLMRPSFAVLRLDDATDLTKTKYEAYICDGKSLFRYDGLVKTITEFKLPLKWPLDRLTGRTHPVIAILAGPNAKDIQERFEVTLFKKDEHYVYLDIKPRSGHEGRDFQHLRLALYAGPKVAQRAYLPAQVYVLKPSGDTELWKFINPQVDLAGVDAKAFQFVPIKGWDVRKVPPAPEKP